MEPSPFFGIGKLTFTIMFKFCKMNSFIKRETIFVFGLEMFHFPALGVTQKFAEAQEAHFLEEKHLCQQTWWDT